MIKDVKKEEEEKQLEEKKEESKIGWFQRVPTIYKLAGVAVIFVKYMQLSNSGGDLKELWMWIIVVVLIWYFLGSEGRRRESTILTPEEAEKALEKEIERKVKAGQIDRWARRYVGPNNGLFHHEGMPQHYQIGIEIVHDDGPKEYKRGIVFAVGETKGYATIQDSMGRLTGREPVPVVSPLPNWLKRSRKYDLDLDKYIFGEKK